MHLDIALDFGYVISYSIFFAQIWQAFVGVQTRRVEKYYQKLISTGVDICETKNWRKQIEKVISCMGLGLVSFNLSLRR